MCDVSAVDWSVRHCTSERMQHSVIFVFHVRVHYMLSPVRLSYVCLSVTLVRHTQTVEIFGNISTAFGTLAIRGHPQKILRRSSQGSPSTGGVKHKRGSQV